MKKPLFLMLAIILVACASPQVTVTRFAEVTVTSPPPTAAIIPTPTLHPQFVELQAQVSASGERFSLLPDGTIQDGAKTVPGLFVDKNGVMTLQVGGESVTFDPEDVSFDDAGGINLKGYTLDEATGLWGVDNKTVFTDSGLTLQLGEADEQGTRVIEQFVAPAEYDGNEAAQAKYLAYFDAERLGFAPDAIVWKYLPDDRVVLVDTNDPTSQIAEYKIVNQTGKLGVVWDWSKMVDENGENVLFGVLKNWEMDGAFPADMDGVLDFGKLIKGRELAQLVNGVEMMYGADYHSQSIDSHLLSQDETQVIVYKYFSYKSGYPLGKNWPYGSTEGFVATRDIKERSIIIYVEEMTYKDF